MKSARAISQKLREVKYHHLVKFYKKYLKKSPENCLYNYPYQFVSDNEDHEIHLCLLHQPNLDLKTGVFPHLIDICQEMKHCQNCNAFLLKYNKDNVKRLFDEELNNKNLKEKKYPDICALEWVLEQPVSDISWIQKIFCFIRKHLFWNL
jgi:hypothetical protein